MNQKRRRTAPARPQQPASAREQIWRVVAAIPAGRVASYGQVARLAGLGRGARQVGRALGELPAETGLPWHRVVNCRGRISLPAGSASRAEQKMRLRAEGVEFSPGGTINLRRFSWR